MKSLQKLIVIFIVFSLLKITNGEAFARIYKSESTLFVTGISTSTAKPGDIVELIGYGFEEKGETENCFRYLEDGRQIVYSCPFVTKIRAHKLIRPGLIGKPNYDLEIISFASDRIEVKIPDNILSGEYEISYEEEIEKDHIGFINNRQKLIITKDSDNEDSSTPSPSEAGNTGILQDGDSKQDSTGITQNSQNPTEETGFIDTILDFFSNLFD